MKHQYSDQQYSEDIFSRLKVLYKGLLEVEGKIKSLEVEEVPESMGGPNLPKMYRAKERLKSCIEDILKDFKEKGALS